MTGLTAAVAYVAILSLWSVVEPIAGVWTTIFTSAFCRNLSHEIIWLYRFVGSFPSVNWPSSVLSSGQARVKLICFKYFESNMKLTGGNPRHSGASSIERLTSNCPLHQLNTIVLRYCNPLHTENKSNKIRTLRAAVIFCFRNPVFSVPMHTSAH